MDLYLQFGYGMKKCTLELAKKWGEATTILSPRDIEPKSLGKWASEMSKGHVKCLFDPQCYYPHDAHPRLAKYGYHSQQSYTNLGTSSDTLNYQLEKIKFYNSIIGTYAYILPGIMADSVDGKWFEKHRAYVDGAHQVLDDKEIYMTIVLPQMALLGNDTITESILLETEKWGVAGYYIVAEHPQQKYLVDSAVWLANLLSLCAGLKLQGKKVIVGYANHQMLCTSLAKVDAIASGTWLNVRSFKNKFKDDTDKTPSRRNTWYYFPQGLSEYKLSILDNAFNNGILSKLRPDPNLDDNYAEVLFSGASPTSTAFNETTAFMHYLHSLKMQAAFLTKESFEETKSAYELMLETAERNIEFCRSNGIFGDDRDFRECVSTARAAMFTLERSRGFVLSQEWKSL